MPLAIAGLSCAFLVHTSVLSKTCCLCSQMYVTQLENLIKYFGTQQIIKVIEFYKYKYLIQCFSWFWVMNCLSKIYWVSGAVYFECHNKTLQTDQFQQQPSIPWGCQGQGRSRQIWVSGETLLLASTGLSAYCVLHITFAFYSCRERGLLMFLFVRTLALPSGWEPCPNERT